MTSRTVRGEWQQRQNIHSMNNADFRDQNLNAERYSTQRVQAENFT